MHDCTDFFSFDDFLQISHGVHIEYYNRQIVFFAHARGCEVHYFQAALQHFIIGDVIEFCSSRVFLRIGRINAIHPCAYQ